MPMINKDHLTALDAWGSSPQIGYVILPGECFRLSYPREQGSYVADIPIIQKIADIMMNEIMGHSPWPDIPELRREFSDQSWKTQQYIGSCERLHISFDGTKTTPSLNVAFAAVALVLDYFQGGKNVGIDWPENAGHAMPITLQRLGPSLSIKPTKSGISVVGYDQ